MRFAAEWLVAMALVLCGCGSVDTGAKKMIVLGIDGMDPGFLERHWTDLPNLGRLRRQGDFRRLGTTVPPQSPVAWSTFITGLNPGGHGIFDFVHRDPATMQPFSSLGETVESKHRLPLGPYSLPLSGGEVRSFRNGTAFWQILAGRGIPVTILHMPVNFPPIPCKCRELAGMGTPDMRGTYGTFTFYTDDPAQTAREVAGGRIVKVTVNGAIVALTIEGPENSLRKDRRRTSVPLAVHLDRDARAARFDLPDQRIILQQGEWSDWLPVKFPLIPGLKSASGIVRIFARELAPRFEIYVSPVNIDPASPDIPISVPASYSRELADAIGPFYTQGIAEDTAAFRQGVFDRKQYLAQSRLVAQEQIALLRRGIEQLRGGLYFQHFLSVDQDSHMLWGRHEDELLETYRLIDGAIGWVMEHAPDAALVVMSDHGFARFDRAFHFNTWLLREGFLTLDDPSRTGADELFAHVDWSKTQAYALGLNALYLNLQGRERHGTVAPGLQAELTLRVISRRLREYRDPQSGQPVVSEVVAGGPSPNAPDLIVGYKAGYRCSWQSALGAVPTETIVDNDDAWIGDHCIAARHVPGALLANRPLRLADPQLADLPVAILAEFGVERPAQMQGRPVF